MLFSQNNRLSWLLFVAATAATASAFVPDSDNAKAGVTRGTVRLQTLTSPRPEDYGAFDPTILVEGMKTAAGRFDEATQQTAAKTYTSPTWNGLTGPTKAFAGLAAVLAASMVVTAPGFDPEALVQWNAAMASLGAQLDFHGLSEVKDAVAMWSSNVDIFTETVKVQSHDLMVSCQSAVMMWKDQIQEAAAVQLAQVQDAVAPQVAQFQSFVADAKDQMQTADLIEEMKSNAIERTAALRESSAAAVAQLESAATDTINDLSSQLAARYEDLSASVGSMDSLDAIGNSGWMDSLKQQASDYSATVADQASAYSAMVAEKASTYSATTLDTVSDHYRSISSEASSIMSTSAHDLSTKAQGMAHGVKDITDTASIPSMPSMDSLAHKASDVPDALAVKATSIADVLPEPSAAMTDAVTESVSLPTPSVVEQVVQQQPETVLEAVPAAVDAVTVPVSLPSPAADTTIRNWNEARHAAVRANEMQYSGLMDKLN